MTGMTEAINEPEARARVEALRAAAPMESACVELAQALLTWSYALDRDGRTADAADAAEEAVKTLSPYFLANPAAHADAMNAIVAEYLGTSQRSRRKADMTLIAPLAAPLGHAEFADEDDD